MKIAKFGGSSLASGTQLKKVAQIIQDNPDTKAVVVSAPGKVDVNDIKVTDLLIRLFEKQENNVDFQEEYDAIKGQFTDIVEELGLQNTRILSDFDKTLQRYLTTIKEPTYLSDAIKSLGEDFSARVLAAYLQSLAMDFDYVSPKEAGIIVSDQPGDAVVLDESYDHLNKLNATTKRYVIPGFFGQTKSGKIVTFSRGGSDISGAIVARGLRADIYENYTDQSYIFTAHPGVVDNPEPINLITYNEIRELSYAGFGIFHEEALQPLLFKDIPIVVKNTNDPKQTGTTIVRKRDDVNDHPIIGVSGSSGYIAITMKEYFLNRKVGYLRKVLEVFEKHGVSVEHVPTGIDYVSVLVRKNQFSSRKDLDAVVQNLYQNFNVENISVEEDLSSIAVVGEGMHDIVGPTHQAAEAFENAHIQPRMIIQGASEISMFFIVKESEENTAIQALYNKFF